MAIKRHHGNVEHAAKELGINRNTMYAFARNHGLGRKGKGANTALSNREISRRVRAWLNNGTDRSAAQNLDMKVFTFTAWRRSHRLPAKGRQP